MSVLVILLSSVFFSSRLTASAYVSSGERGGGESIRRIRVNAGEGGYSENVDVELHPGQNCVYGRLGRDATVILLKENVTSPEDCAKLCIERGRSCGSFAWHSPSFPNPDFKSKCIATTKGYFDWFPTLESQVTSGRIEWGCSSAAECSLNGKCSKYNHTHTKTTSPKHTTTNSVRGNDSNSNSDSDSDRFGVGSGGLSSLSSRCECESGWRGHACQILDTQPVDKNKLGFRSIANGMNASSWGGSVLFSELDGKWHMWASELQHNCGLNTWCQNSRIVHATATDEHGPYHKQEVLFPRYSHEPTVVRDPTSGRFVMYFTAQRPVERPLCTNCSNGLTLDGCGDLLCNPNTDATWMAHTETNSAWGPWSRPVIVLKDTGSDTNLSPLILRNGSLVGMWRSFAPTKRSDWFGSKLHLITGERWDDPSTYMIHRSNIFPSLSNWTNWAGAEDPFLYQTKHDDGTPVFHAILHNLYGCGTGLGSRPCGTHAFSLDGWEWNLSGSGAYHRNIHFTDGSELVAVSRERPHLVLNDTTGLPTALITGTGYVGDATFTLVQPLQSST